MLVYLSYQCGYVILPKAKAFMSSLVLEYNRFHLRLRSRIANLTWVSVSSILSSRKMKISTPFLIFAVNALFPYSAEEVFNKELTNNSVCILNLSLSFTYLLTSNILMVMTIVSFKLMLSEGSKSIIFSINAMHQENKQKSDVLV